MLLSLFRARSNGSFRTTPAQHAGNQAQVMSVGAVVERRGRHHEGDEVNAFVALPLTEAHILVAENTMNINSMHRLR